MQNQLCVSIKWNTGNGNDTSIWEDWWCGDCLLSKMENVNTVLANDKEVSALIKNNREWDMAVVMNEIPNNMKDIVLTTPLPLTDHGDDTPSWLGKGDGKFKVSSCYNQTINE